MTSWICCQLGAREHYAVARALLRKGALTALLTDAWAPPDTPWAMVPGETGQRLSERFSPELASATVKGFTASLVANEASWRLRGLKGWPLVMERNHWFQTQCADALEGMPPNTADVVFAHSYAALATFRVAKARGMTTVLGQIDPGEKHGAICREASARWPDFGPPLAEPDAAYFHGWREECRLADRIIVNSDWSAELLRRAGIAKEKVEIVALPFEAEQAPAAFARAYPARFDAQRPLRLLFVGSVAVFKGVPSLLEAVDLLKGLPIELRVVGPMAAAIPATYQNRSDIRWVGAVSRSEVMAHMRDADVLMFPSHSDGFGMAQAEAQQWRLPIVASRSSGRVVEHGRNGLLLDVVSGPSIADAIRMVLDPAILAGFASGAECAGMTLDTFGDALMAAVPVRSR